MRIEEIEACHHCGKRFELAYDETWNIDVGEEESQFWLEPVRPWWRRLLLPWG
jgi:hypothetical protein